MRGETRLPLFWVMAIAALLAVGLAAFAGLGALATRDKTLADETSDLARLSLILAEYTQRVVFGADLIASSMQDDAEHAGLRSSDEFLRYAATEDMHGMLQERVVQSSGVDALSLVDAQGMLVNSSRFWPPPKVDLSDRAYFIALRDNPDRNYAISARLKNRVTGQDTITLARRVSAPDGKFQGLILATIAASRFEKLFAAVLPDSDASISLYRRDGVVLARQPRLEGMVEQSPEIRRHFEETMAGAEQGTLRTETGDSGTEPQLAAMHAVRGYPLVISVTSSEATVLAGWWKLAKLMFAFAAAAIVLVALLAFAFFRQWKMQARMVETADKLGHANRELAAANEELNSFTYSVAHARPGPRALT